MSGSWFNSRRFLRLTALVFIAWLAAAFCGTDPSALAGGPYKNPSRPGAQPADPYAVPDGGPEKLIDFINKMRRLQPAKNAQAAEKQMLLTKANTAMLAAADKLLEGDVSAAQRVTACTAKLQAILFLRQANSGFGQPSDKQLEDLAKQLKDEKDPELAKLYKQASFALLLSALARGDKDSAKAWDDIKAELTANPPDHKTLVQVEAAARLVEHLETSDTNLTLLQQINFDLLDIMLKQNDTSNTFLAKKVAAVARRLSLVGKPLEIKGRGFDGKQVDLANYAGKVVLVQFWAAHVSQSASEVTLAKQLYDKYHSKGFEVVGINCDEDKDLVKRTITDQKIPWPNLFIESKESRGFKHPLAIQYGVDGVPVGILVNRNGVVVSILARGPELEKMLEQLLPTSPVAGTAPAPNGQPSPGSAPPVAGHKPAASNRPAASNAAATDSGQEKAFVSKEGGFSVLFPGTPQSLDQQVDTPSGGAAAHTLISTANRSVYQITYFDLPGVEDAKTVDAEKTLDAARDALAKTGQSHVTAENKIKLGAKWPGREIVLAPTGPIGRQYLWRVYSVNARVYEIGFGGLLSHGPADDVTHKFFDSFKIAGDEKDAASGWKPFTSKWGRFAVQFPGPVDWNAFPMGIGASAKHATHVLLRSKLANRSVFSVVFSDPPDELTAEQLKNYDVEAKLKRTRDSICNQPGIRLVKESRVTLDNKWPGVELVFEAIDDSAMDYTHRIYYVNNREYQLSAHGPKGHKPPEDDIQRFFNSFKALEAEANVKSELKPLASKEGRFVVEFPGDPVVQEAATESPIGKMVMHQFQSTDGDGQYLIVYGDLPATLTAEDLKNFDVESALEGATNGIVAAMKCRLAKDIKISLNNSWPGRELTLEPLDGSVVEYTWRIYYVKTRQYQIVVGGVKGHKPSDETIQKVFDSFKATAE